MKADEAKAETYKVRPPIRPSQALYDQIKRAASEGERAVSPCVGITDENRWWLEDEGYSFSTVDGPTAARAEIVVRIHW